MTPRKFIAEPSCKILTEATRIDEVGLDLAVLESICLQVD